MLYSPAPRHGLPGPSQAACHLQYNVDPLTDEAGVLAILEYSWDNKFGKEASIPKHPSLTFDLSS